MSARDDVLDLMRYSEGWFDGSDTEFEEAISVQLDAYKAEILHEAAEKIRAADFGDPYYTGTGQHDAANLTDPEVAS
jgi:hypothetical protein